MGHFRIETHISQASRDVKLLLSYIDGSGPQKGKGIKSDIIDVIKK